MRDKSDTYKRFSSSDISFFNPRISSESDKIILGIKKEIALLLNPLCLIYASFHLFLSSCEIYHNLSFQHIHIYVWKGFGIK